METFFFFSNVFDEVELNFSNSFSICLSKKDEKKEIVRNIKNYVSANESESFKVKQSRWKKSTKIFLNIRRKGNGH